MADAKVVPAHLARAIEEWLAANEKQPDEVRWGSFPLGMVQRWIERAEIAEAALAAARGDTAASPSSGLWRSDETDDIAADVALVDASGE